MSNKDKSTTSAIERGDSSLEVGYVVALSLVEGAAPLRSYVGQIEAIDDRGIRLTLIDWIAGRPDSWDLFVPWESITAALVATESHAVNEFGDPAADWQGAMSKLGIENV